MELINSKSILAKLMATENLSVEQRSVPTAFFDVENRILTVPILDNRISSQLYDLFMGHEVGHALYTPAIELKENLIAGVDQTIINVVEDSRIERKIKYRYPGLSKSFVKGYTELVERDFFGTNGQDLSDMNFIDRVNIHCKGGPAQGIKFDEIERELLDKVENTQTFDDVIRVSKEIVEYMKLEQKEKNKKGKFKVKNRENPEKDENSFQNMNLGDKNEQEKDESENSGKSKSKESDKDEDQKENSQQNSKNSDTKDKKSDKDEKNESTEGITEENDNKIAQNQLKSHTDEAFRKNESKLFDKKSRDYVYADLPDLDINKAIFDYKDFYKKYKKGGPDGQSYRTGKEHFSKIRIESEKVVSYLVKEFELRKNADQMKKTSVSKTGDLNMSKIFSYQFNEDIFKKISVMPDGKSHGLVMFLDWSGSMGNHIANTMRQLFNLVLFCKKVNIPYEVYAFTCESLPEYTYEVTPKNGNLAFNKFSLMNILSHRMSASDFMYAGSVLCAIGHIGSSEGERFPWWTSLSSTPLNQAIISAAKIVPEFQKKNKLQIVNTIFLTDGESDSIDGVYQEDGKYNKPLYGLDVLVIRDPKTKNQETIRDCQYGANVTTGLIKLLKKLTDCNIIGFYVLAGSEFNRKIHRFYDFGGNQKRYDTLAIQFRKDNYSVVTSAGFDEYYLLRSQGMAIDDDAEFEVKENATTRGIVSAFSKYTGNKLNNRVVLNRFIKMIA